MADPTSATQKRVQDALAETKRRLAEMADRKARTAQQGIGSAEHVVRDETADARKARQNADIMSAADEALQTAKRTGDPLKLRAAISCVQLAREVTGETKAVRGNVTIEVVGVPSIDDDDDSPGLGAVEHAPSHVQ